MLNNFIKYKMKYLQLDMIKHRLGEINNKLFYLKYLQEIKKSNELLINIKDIHYGKKCFIVATGPSLNETNIGLIDNDIIFGMNTLYKAINRFKKIPEYWGVLDSKVLKKYYKEILKIDSMLFLGGSAGRYFLKHKKVLMKYSKNKPIILRAGKDMNFFEEFSTDILKGANGAGTVTIDVCLQMAYYMGFSEVYLIGCDTDFSGNHFDGTNTKKSGYNIQRRYNTYRVCKETFENNGRKIYNSTVGGKLEVFERKKLEDVLIE